MRLMGGGGLMHVPSLPICLLLEGGRILKVRLSEALDFNSLNLLEFFQRLAQNRASFLSSGQNPKPGVSGHHFLACIGNSHLELIFICDKAKETLNLNPDIQPCLLACLLQESYFKGLGTLSEVPSSDQIYLYRQTLLSLHFLVFISSSCLLDF